MDQYYEVTCKYRVIIPKFEEVEHAGAEQILIAHTESIEYSIMESDMVPDFEDCVPSFDWQMMPKGWRPKDA